MTKKKGEEKTETEESGSEPMERDESIPDEGWTMDLHPPYGRRFERKPDPVDG